VAGVANFAGVDQATPLGPSNGANGNSTASSVTLGGLSGYELVFDNVFQGASGSSQTLTAGFGQTEQWNAYISNTRAAGSTEQATGSSVTMSWTAASSSYWAIVAVAIIPTDKIPACNIVLGRPTNNSVSVNAIISQGGQAYFEYGTASGTYTSGQTATLPVTAGQPVKTVISGLAPNKQYYYRLRFQPTGLTEWASGEEFSFHTQRAQGQTFTFTLISDSHLGQTFSGNDPDRYWQTTLNVAEDAPDFHLDLGDAFITSLASDEASVNDLYLDQRPYFGNFSHSAPVFLVIGNHENEEGWNLDDTFSRGLASINARKRFFLNPIPDGFYTGNPDTTLSALDGADKHREDYYAWTWGDALFVVLDPFQYTMTKPYGTVTGSGEDTPEDETVSGDQWNWTLGKDQFDWFKETLENSNARFKFVFSHHVTGGQLDTSGGSGGAGPPTYVRGGAIAAPYFEWGGLNSSGSPVFTTQRPGWGDPIHQLMIDEGVSAFFHGHDHQFVHEVRDGIVYQLVPAAGMTGYGFDLYDYISPPYVVSGGNLPNAGHVRVTVSLCQATVDYVRSCITGDSNCTNGQVAYSYTIDAPLDGDIQPVSSDCDVDGSDLAALIASPGSLEIAKFAANFGKGAS
jgi:hypothetical protein